MGRGNSSTSLAPGFRFHPTDEELVWYYLKRKVCNKPFRFDPISVIDIYKSEPWDLPDKSKLKSRDLEWYFFSVLDKKYGNSSRTNRATERGYWKTTGKDRPVCHNSRTVGMKKTLVYHKGRAPRGERTNWVMHEYRLADEELSKSGVQQEAFVLCRVFQKSGSGPKNGEQYGAPFVEEEWEDDDVGYVPGQDVVADEVAVSDDAFVEVNDVDQNIEVGNASGEAPLPLNFCYGESSNYADDSIDFSENYQEPMMRRNDTQCGMEMSHGQMLPNLLEDEMVASPVKEEQTIDSINNANPVDPSYFHDETYMGMTDIPPIDDGLFLEANDLSNPIKVEPTGFDIEDYLSSFDVDEYLSFDVDELTESEIPVPDQERLNQKHVSGDDEQAVAKSKHVDVNGSNSASSAEQKPDSTEFKPDVNYPFIKKASQMLGSYPAPPAFASEFPTKDATLRLNAAQSSSSVHVTAGMMRVTDVALAGSGMDWSLSKTGGVNIIFSFSLLQGDPNSSMLTPMGNLLPGKMASRSCFLLMFFWVLLLSLSLKIGTCIYAR